MNDIFLLLLFVAAFAVAWTCFSLKRRKEWPNLFSAPAMAVRGSVLAGAISAVVLSPVAAIPSVLVLSVLMVSWDAWFGIAPQLAGDMQEATKQVLGRSYVAVVATADLFARHLLISGPLLLAGGYAIAAYSIGSGVFWRRYSRGLLLFGTVYPVVFVAAAVFGWFDGPFFN